MSGGHTSGPWYVADDYVICARDPSAPDEPWWIAETIPYAAHEGEPREANARLIASAPDLLAALEGLLAVVDQMDKPVSSGGGVLPVNKAVATGAARAAIARTKTGEGA